MNRLDLLKEDLYFKEFFKKNNLSDEYINQHLSKLFRIYESRNMCNACKGLYMCRQASNGQRLDIRYEGVLIYEVEYCNYALSRLKKENLAKSYVYCDVPNSLIDIDLDNIKYTDEQEELYYKLASILHKKSDRGLYICGENGTGKTYLCIALANSLVKNKQKVSFVKASNFFNEMKSYLGNSSEVFETLINKLQRCTYLFLDDIGCEVVSEFVRDDILFRILDYRLENKLTTIFTSNRDKENLLQRYTYDRKNNSDYVNAKRLLVRIDTLADDYVLLGKDMRKV